MTEQMEAEPAESARRLAGATPVGRFRPQAGAAHVGEREFGEAVDAGWRPMRPRWRFPDIRRLRETVRGPIRRVPVIVQSQASDCGPASLSMVLQYHGIAASVDQLRAEMNIGRAGISAKAILETGRRHGLAGRGVRLSLAGLRELAPASILFWNFNHFVVFERVTRDHVQIVDPAFGRRRVGLDVASTAFTGVALEFEVHAGAAAKGTRIRSGRFADSPWRYIGRFLPLGPAWLPLIAASLLLLAFNFTTPLLTAYVVDHASHRTSGLGSAGAMLAAVVVAAAYFVLQGTRSLAILSIQTRADKSVTLGVLGHLLSLPYEFFTRRSAADLALRVRTSQAVRQVLTTAALSATFDGLLVVLYGVILAIADPGLAVVACGLAVFQVGLLAVGWRRQQDLFADALEVQAQSDSELVELLNGVPTLKAAASEGLAGERWSHTFAQEVNRRVRARRNLAGFTGLSTAVQFIAPLLVLLVGYSQVARGQASLGEVVGFASLAIGMLTPLTSLVQAGLQVASLGATLARLGDVLEAEPEDVSRAPFPVQSAAGPVELRAVGYTYPGTITEVVRDIHLSVPAGGFVAIAGRTGCGKSTLATLIAGLLVPSAGEISIGGLPLDRYDRTTLRRSISFVSQESRLFARSIRDNIALGCPGATEDQIVTAARRARIDLEIRALPMGYDTLLGPDGNGLSGGQRQRVALARALVREPRLLILDEATSALDRETEEDIVRGLRRTTCTLIMITHRLTAVRSADRVLVMELGRVVQDGSPADLLSVPGPFRAMYGADPDGER